MFRFMVDLCCFNDAKSEPPVAVVSSSSLAILNNYFPQTITENHFGIELLIYFYMKQREIIFLYVPLMYLK